MSQERIAHAERVARVVHDWAEAISVPDSERNRWLRAVWLHDALRDAPDQELLRWAPTIEGPVELRHGPASAARAKAEGELDRGVLDAVRYHSIGLAEWDMVGRILYCADYLEPGRSSHTEREAELLRRLPKDVRGVLRAVASIRIGYNLERGRALLEPTVRFWNSLCVHETRASA